MRQIKGYVATLDVLGFSELLQREGYATQLKVYLKCINDVIRPANKEVECVVFSDSIVLTSAGDDDDSFKRLVWACSAAFSALLKNEIRIVPGSSEGSFLERMEPMARPSRYSPEVRERAIRMVREHGPEHPSQWAAIASIASKLGCTPETLRRWVRQAERDTGHRSGLTTDERQRLNELEREVRELKRANEILRKASAYFAQAELDRRPK